MSSIVNPTSPSSPLPEQVSRGQIPSRRFITMVGLAHVAWALLLLYVLLKTWPPDPWPNPASKMYFFSYISLLRFDLPAGSPDQHLIFIVIVLGALGALIHSSVSFSTYIGNRKFMVSWTWWYLLRPFVGAALALALYFVVRAGFLNGSSSTTNLNPFGVAMLAIMSGLFSKQATDKLEEVFTTLFKPGPGKGDAQRGDKLTPPTITDLTPPKGPQSGGTKVKITGTGFVDHATVTFGGVAAQAVVVESVTSITATTPKHAPGTVTVVVKNPDLSQATATMPFTYTDETTPGGGPAGLTVTTFTPPQGPAAGGTEVTITGTGFVAKATVKFGDAEVAAVVESATAIKATTPKHDAGSVAVSVKNPDGKEAKAPTNFTFV